MEDLSRFDKKIISAISKEFATLWVVRVADLSMSIYAQGGKSQLNVSVDIISKMTYEQSRKWYVENAVIEADREKVLRESSLDYLLPRLCTKGEYFVNYKRLLDGRVNHNQLFYSILDKENGEVTYFLLGFRDIDTIKRAELDEITGLYNRQAFLARAQKELKEHPDVEYDLLISDFVDFKQINEKYGVQVGDKLLKYYGNYLLGRSDENLLVGRYGSDQFAALYNHKTLEARLMEGDYLTPLIDVDDLPTVVVKFGIYRNVDHNDPIVATCDKAHMALNTIKHAYGKDLAIYGEAIKKKVETQRKIESHMHEALEEKQFRVYYQPKIDVMTGRIIGAEALIRWIHPEFGFMSPGDFIPVFEKNGFITEADSFVWSRTCENLRRWSDEGINTVPISVNMSKLDFQSEGFMDRIKSSIEVYNIGPDKLHVEITETLMADDTEELIKILMELKGAGFLIELDDFGSGYSSINVLSEYPIDVVKLDMSFVKQLDDEKRFKVLAACINLAKNLGYKTISEGVETEKQNDLLRGLGVDAIQGYYYSKPLPEDEFEKFIKEHGSAG